MQDLWQFQYNLVDIPQKEFRKLIGKFVIVFVNMKVSRII